MLHTEAVSTQVLELLNELQQKEYLDQFHLVGHVLKSLAYFEDVDLNDWPVMLRDPELEWPAVKNRIINEVKNYTFE